MTIIQIIFLIIAIALIILGALTFSAHLTDNLDRDMAPFTGRTHKPSFFSAIPFPLSFVFGIAAVVILAQLG